MVYLMLPLYWLTVVKYENNQKYATQGIEPSPYACCQSQGQNQRTPAGRLPPRVQQGEPQLQKFVWKHWRAWGELPLPEERTIQLWFNHGLSHLPEQYFGQFERRRLQAEQGVCGSELEIERFQ